MSNQEFRIMKVEDNEPRLLIPLDIQASLFDIGYSFFFDTVHPFRLSHSDQRDLTYGW